MVVASDTGNRTRHYVPLVAASFAALPTAVGSWAACVVAVLRNDAPAADGIGVVAATDVVHRADAQHVAAVADVTGMARWNPNRNPRLNVGSRTFGLHTSYLHRCPWTPPSHRCRQS